MTLIYFQNPYNQFDCTMVGQPDAIRFFQVSPDCKVTTKTSLVGETTPSFKVGNQISPSLQALIYRHCEPTCNGPLLKDHGGVALQTLAQATVASRIFASILLDMCNSIGR